MSTLKEKYIFYAKRLPLLGGSFAVIFFLFLLFLNSPTQKGEGVIVYTKGDPVVSVLNSLESQGIIRSKILAQVFVKLFYKERSLWAGEYTIPPHETTLEVIHFLFDTYPQPVAVTVTIPEGLTRVEIARLLEKKLPLFDTQKFLEITKKDEGFLFPDTYSFGRDETVESIRKKLLKRGDDVWQGLMKGREVSSQEKERIYIIASLLEEEGKTFTDRSLIAGIIENRLQIGMRLQLDATINYIKGYADTTVSFDDTKIQSLYNTYLHAGLPPTPISNPGKESLEATLSPQKTSYMYYLTGKDGKFYYAKTFEEHKKNKYLYLR